MWFSSLFRPVRSGRRCTRPGRRPTPFRLTVESLEARFAPAGGLSAALVADILPGSAGSNPANYVVLNNALYFTANDGVHGSELYKSDGTAAGTVLVKDINPGSGDSNPTALTPVGSTLYFSADDGVHGLELWKTDGTAAGTVFVKDINPGSGSSTPEAMADIKGTLFFSANDGVHGPELWKSNGTAAGTVLVKDINSGSGGSGPEWLTNVNGVAFFSAFDGKNGRELWKSDGTTNGTKLVTDIFPGDTYLYNGCLFDCFGKTKSKLIDLGTASSDPSGLTNVNGTLYFVAADTQSLGGGGIPYLYKSDGTSGGTKRVADVVVGSSLINVDGTVFFSGSYGLWKSNGTAAGTVLVTSSVQPGGRFVSVNGTLFFDGDGVGGNELWKSDGTTAGTVLVKDIYPGISNDVFNDSSPSRLTNVNGLLYFSAEDGVSGRELWQSDGTEAGTVMVQDINPGSAASDPQDLVAMNNKLYFSADDGVHGRELWDPPAVLTPKSLPFTGHGSGGFTDASGDFFATGIASHLGAFTHYGTLVFTPTDDPFVFAVTGRTVYQAANGDVLYAVTDGTLNVLTGVVTGTDTWDGGTGRFADASGVVDLSGQLLPDGLVTFSLLGSIAA
jgi:ELWxxDGT repeat protein